MFGNLSPSWKEKEYIVRLPKEHIWFVQHLLHTSEGVALVTLASMKDQEGEFVVITNTDQEMMLVELMKEIQKQLPAVTFEPKTN
jgi:nitrate reductase NapAB chaperone NapD